MLSPDSSLLEHLLPKLSRRINLKGDAGSTKVTGLTPKTEYSLTVHAVYPGRVGESSTIRIETTPVPPVANFRVIEEGLFSLRLGWTSPIGLVDNYKIYIPRSDRPGLTYEQMLQGDSSSHVIDSLEEDKTYTVSIYAIYPEGPSEPVSVVGRTLKLVPVPQLLVQNATTDTVQARWLSVRGASGYRITWASSEGHIESVNLGDNFNFYMVQGLHPGTDYTVTINPIFVDIEGPVTSVKAKTCESENTSECSSDPLLCKTDFFDLDFLNFLSDGSSPQKHYLDRSVLQHSITRLRPNTLYSISIHALFGNTEGPEISLSQQTASSSDSEQIDTVREVKVVDIGMSSLTIAWRKTPAVTGYKVTWSPFHGGEEQNEMVASSSTSYTITGLPASTAYKIQVTSVVGEREGSSVTVTARTLDLPKVNGLIALNTTDNSTTLSWTSVTGASAYLLTWRHISEVESTTDVLGPGFTSYKIRDLQYGRTYIFTIRPLYGEVEGPITTITKRIGENSLST
uniref:Fibronectin type-III domain-containing protein n=1 Tax=Astyanax mexicanus TaxID=7994 RepID=A0A8B9JQA2_ASTMX